MLLASLYAMLTAAAAAADRPCFYEVDISLDGAPIHADRAPVWGVEVPNVRYGPGERPAGPAPRIALSPLVYGERVDGAALHPRRRGPGEIVFRIGLHCSADATPIERRWYGKFKAANARAPTPTHRTGRRPFVARVVLMTNADIDLLVQAQELFRDKSTEPPGAHPDRVPKGLRLVTLENGESIRLVHQLPAGAPVPLYLLGDGLAVELPPY